MKLFSSNTEPVEDLNPTDVEDAIKLFFVTEFKEIRLVKAEEEWMRVYWGSGVGIKAQFRDPDSGRIFEDKTLFMGLRQFKALVRSFSRGTKTWKHIVKWHPLDARPSFKRLVERGIWVVRITSIVVVTIMLIAGVLLGLLYAFGHEQWDTYWEGLLIVIGIGGISWSVVDFVYFVKDDVTGDYYAPMEALFPISILILIVAFTA